MPDYELSQTNSGVRRGRCIAPTADLSALGGFPDIPMKNLIRIIEPRWILGYPILI